MLRLSPLLLVGAFACGTPDADDDPTTRLTADGLYRVTATPTPDPPVAGENELQLTILDADTEAPLTDASLTVEPYMPSMNHGIMGEVTISALGEGVWVAAWSYSMPGPWTVTVTIDAEAGTDDVVFEYEVQ